MTQAIAIFTLGGLRIERDGAPVGGLASRKAEALLVYLAMTGRTHPRERLGDLLWDDLTGERARGNLSVLLTSLRQALGPVIAGDRQQVGLAAGAALTCDAHQFAAELETALAGRGAGGELSEAAAAAAASALARYGGEFLQGFSLRDGAGFEAWALAEQDRLRGLALAGRAALAAYHLARGEGEAGAEHARALLAIDPLSEDGNRLLMQLLAAAGRRPAALAHFERYRQLLAAELGAAPSPELVAAHQAIWGQPVAAEAAPRAAGGVRGLPPALAGFYGREVELARIDALLAEPGGRLISIVGPGGIGKSSLAARAAADHAAHLAQGAAFVPLAALSDPGQLPGAIADALGLRLAGPGPPAQQLAEALREMELLLVLDNLEQLIAAPAQPGGQSPAALVGGLLAAAPGLRVLTTSRERLGLVAEQLIDLNGLAYPRAELIERLDPQALAAFSSVQLFVERARAVRPGLALDQDTLRAILQICALVDGVPLGIELAAGLARARTPAQIAAAVTGSADTLATRLRDVPYRHRSMRIVFDQSWRLLGRDEQALMRRLAIFRGGFGREAAIAVCGAGPAQQVEDALFGLIEKSLLRLDDAGRYQLHELVRQFAEEQLTAQPDELAAVGGRHLGHYAAWVAAITPELNGRRRAALLAQLAAEIDNLRAAWRWAARRGDAAALAMLVHGLAAHYDARGHFQEAYDELGGAAQALPGPGSAVVLARQGLFAERLGRYEEAEALLGRALELARAAADRPEEGRTLALLGRVVEHLGRFAEAVALNEASLAIARAAGDLAGEAQALHNLGSHHEGLGAYEEAQRVIEQSLALRRRGGDLRGEAFGLNNLGVVVEMRGDYREATALYLESMTLFAELGDRWAAALPLGNLGDVAAARGDLGAAGRYYAQALRLARDLHVTPQILTNLVKLAQLMARRGAPAEAAVLLGPAIAHPATPATFREAASRLLAELTEALPAEDLAAALERGRAAGVSAVMAAALSRDEAAQPHAPVMARRGAALC